MKVSYEAKSDIGLIRDNNEDAMSRCLSTNDLQKTKGSLFVIADGLGGMPDGEIASRLAVNTVINYWEESCKFNDQEALNKACYLANKRVCEQNQGKDYLNKMATTLTASLASGNNLLVAHIGDSRAYLATKMGFRQLTIDHSIGEHRLTRCLGLDENVLIDNYYAKLEVGDILLQSTDGLHGQVAEDLIHKELLNQNLKEACEHLIVLAKNSGGLDNITVQVALFR